MYFSNSYHVISSEFMRRKCMSISVSFTLEDFSQFTFYFLPLTNRVSTALIFLCFYLPPLFSYTPRFPSFSTLGVQLFCKPPSFYTCYHSGLSVYLKQSCSLHQRHMFQQSEKVRTTLVSVISVN